MTMTVGAIAPVAWGCRGDIMPASASVSAVGSAMRGARLRAGLTQAELAERAGVNRATVTGVECCGNTSWGRHLAINGTLVAMAYALATISWKFLKQPVMRSRWAPRR